ncbi:MAG: glutaminyl-peptide cyclotransferase [Pyrinomonadaceae bacterium]
MRILFMVLIAAVAFGCSSGSANVSKANANNANARTGPPPVYGYEVVNSYPHDPNAFTQGLFFHNGFLYESTGEYGGSSIRKIEIETGKVVQKSELPRDIFAEGMALLGDKIYQLTWKERTCRVYDVNDFKLLQEFSYQGDGWGLTTDGTNLFMTDSTHVMRVLNPETFRSVRMIAVMRDDGKPLMQLNELEYIKGEIWANIWHSEQPDVLGKPNHIARIDPSSGKILGWVSLAGISPADQPPGSDENTLNGIAYDATGDRIFVTGKKWKKLYEIKIKPPQA